MHTGLHGKSAVVTGSSRGIGLAVARRLVQAGARVVLNGRDEAALDSARSELVDAQKANVTAVAGSMSDPEVPRRLIERAVEEFGSVDFVVNNVAISPAFGLIEQLEVEKVDRTLRVNAVVPLALVQEALRAGLDEGGGAVVNITTIGARQVQPLIAPYSASKAALESFTRVMARELGPRGVRVNGVAPGLVKTDMSEVFWKGDRGEQEVRMIPLQRVGEPDDIATAVTFLLSAEASWITGVIIDVDGGRLLVGDEQPAELLGVYGRTVAL